MSYASLRPPEPEVFDESDENSIQGSPLLDTGSRFDSRPPTGPVSGTYTYEEPLGTNGAAEPPWKSRYSSGYATTESEPSAPSGPYEGTTSDAAPVGLGLGHHQVPTGPVTGPYEGPYEGPSDGAYNGVDGHYIPPGVPEEGPAYNNEYSNEHRNGAAAQPRPESAFDPHAPGRPSQTISQINNSRLSLPTNLAYSENRDAVPAMPSAHSTLQFGNRQSRPYSSLLRESLAPGNQPSIAEPDDDDDALPFETTTQQSAQNRPLSAIHLSQMSTGMVMSKDKFENYRKSLSSLDLLKREGSIISRTGSTHKKDDESADGDNAVEEDVEDEFLSSEKERKRKLAKERQKQEARMSVYRQRMTKMIGGTSPSTHAVDSRSISTAYPFANPDDATDLSDDDDDELMDDIPLGILQAHGFPRNRRKSMGALSTMSPTLRPSASSSSPLTPHTPPNFDSRPPSVVSSRMLVRPASLPPQQKPASMANVFGDKEAFVNRGLVAEIAKEQDLRRRRNTLAFQNAHGIMSANAPAAAGRSDAASQYTAGDGGSAGVIGEANMRELNTKLDALFELLKDRRPAEFSRPGSIMGGVAGSGPLGEHMAQMRAVPQRPESMRSFVTTPYTPSMPDTAFYSSSQLVPGTPATRASYGFQPPPPPQPHMGAPLGAQMGPQHMVPPMGAGPGIPAGYPVPPPGMSPGPQGVPTGAELRVNNRPSRMRLVAAEDDDEDDEVEMQKLLHKRQALRAQWREQATTTTT